MTQAATKSKTMAELRACKKSLFIKNETPFLWTLHERVGDGRIDLELRPASQPDSITYLPPSALDAPGIARNIASGKITVSPDLEEEMMGLMATGSTTSKKLLDQYQIQVQESPQSRAIDAKEKMDGLLDNVQRRRTVTPQAGLSGDRVDEFINPAPFKAEDGRMFDPKTGQFLTTPEEAQSTEIKSVTITRPSRMANPEEN